ncbi:MAG: hypothetical protein EXS15_03620 [Phycisphaerales bacterium]|nr:hypothetical protein [Phycisphaerales bacterium]
MVCPVIGLLLLAIVAWLVVSGLKIRDLARAPAIACGHCGHFLLAGQLRCPECGTLWDMQWLQQLTNARQRSGTIRLTLAGVLVLLLAAAVIAAVVPLWNYGQKQNQPAQTAKPNQPITLDGPLESPPDTPRGTQADTSRR